MAKLNPCPVCGRDPKMVFETMPDGVTALVRLECRGMFRLHCAADAADYYQVEALVRAEEKWNKATEQGRSTATTRTSEPKVSPSVDTIAVRRMVSAEELAQERKARHG